MILFHHHQYVSYQRNYGVNLLHRNYSFLLIVHSYSSVQQFRSVSQVCELYSMYHHHITNIITYLILLRSHQYISYQSNRKAHLHHRSHSFLLAVHSYSLVWQFRSAIQVCELYSMYHHYIINISTYIIFFIVINIDHIKATIRWIFITGITNFYRQSFYIMKEQDGISQVGIFKDPVL